MIAVTSTPMHSTLDDWIAREAIPFSIESSEDTNAAIDKVVATLGDAVELLGFGEALHGGEEILTFRNQLFRRLVEAHGYSAIALESSFPRGHLMNAFVAGQGPSAYEEVRFSGFSHGFGRLDANRELVEWMRLYNADPSRPAQLQIYGFDSPTEMGSSDSPRALLHFTLDYLAGIGAPDCDARTKRIDSLLCEDTAWANPAATMDPSKSIGLSPEATALRIETEELISDLTLRRPELVSKSDTHRYLEAMHHASLARQMLNYHAALARNSDQRLGELLGIRDAMMADNLSYIVSRERGRGKVLAFAHNSHLKCGQAQWQFGPNLLVWWPAGSHLRQMLGGRYAVIGSAVGVSDGNGIGSPNPGTLEARLTALPGSAVFIPTHQGKELPASEITSVPVRSGRMGNPSYTPLTSQSFTDFDWLAAFHSSACHRGGPPAAA